MKTRHTILGLAIPCALAAFAVSVVIASKGDKQTRAQELEQETVCTVVKLSTGMSPDMTTCMIECIYRKGTTIGLATSTPVPCEGWHGREITRE